MNNILIRNIKEEDIEDVVDINIKGWKLAYKGIIEDEFLNNISREEKIEKRKMDYKENGFIVATKNDKVVGFCRYIDNINKTTETPEADCELRALYVKPELKRKGIGKKLFEYALNEFKNLGKRKMIIGCLKDNEPSKKFYEKMGGSVIKERLIHIGNRDYEEVIFEYDI